MRQTFARLEFGSEFSREKVWQTSIHFFWSGPGHHSMTLGQTLLTQAHDPTDQ
jgi:hypothetical protein